MQTFFTVFIICFSNLCFSQNFLELKKLGKEKKIEFYPGEEIRFKLKNDENFSRAYIHHLIKSGETLGLQLISLHNIYFMNLMNSQ